MTHTRCCRKIVVRACAASVAWLSTTPYACQSYPSSETHAVARSPVSVQIAGSTRVTFLLTHGGDAIVSHAAAYYYYLAGAVAVLHIQTLIVVGGLTRLGWLRRLDVWPKCRRAYQ